MDARDLLLEIGVEELPSSYVDGALSALPQLVDKKLAALRLSHAGLRAKGTPRRLALFVDGLASRQRDLDEEVLGPSASVAFDKEGKPTKAAEAFAKKLGLAVTELRKVDTPKGAYVAGTRREAGRDARELLPEVLRQTISELPFRKSMRWASYDETFGRPVRWLVALFGDDVVELSFAGQRAGRTTYGHRFLAPAAREVTSIASYEADLLAAHVVVDPAARRLAMVDALHAAAARAGGALIDDEFLVAENLSLVEEPHVVVGSFEPRFLELPDEVILEVARGHQRYFGLRGPDGALLPAYLAVVGTALRPDLVAKGNDRVMRARLSDARFFFDEDRKVGLAARRPKLDGIVFHNRLGTIGEKVTRVVALTGALADRLKFSGDERARAVRAAELAKCDLVSLMVGEFPELQGVMGRAYALSEGEDPRVAAAIREHYLPRSASDAVAPSREGALVGLADRLDSLVGCFAIGLSPSGAADPFALRRACLGVLRTLIAQGWDLGTRELVRLAYPAFSGKKLELDAAATEEKLTAFFRDRLRNLLVAELPTDVVDACLAAVDDRSLDARARAVALAHLDAAVRAGAGEVFKRVANIAKEAPPGDASHPAEHEASPHASELALWDAIVAARPAISAAMVAGDHASAFGVIAALSPRLADYFTHVFVMAEAPALRDNRLKMLRGVRDVASSVAHFQLLGG